MSTSEKREYPVTELLKRFVPYYKPYIRTLVFDLFCAALTCGAELVLPMIIRYLTNTAVDDITALSIKIVGQLVLLYFVLRMEILLIR